MTLYDLVIFDCDGVLVDSEPIACRCAAQALTAIGYPIDQRDVQARFLGMSVASMVQSVEEELGRSVPAAFVDGLRRSILAAFERDLKPIPGVARMLDEMTGPVCVASSSNPERVRRSLELTELLDRLHPHLFSASMVARGKPAPDLFLYAAEQMEAAPRRCVVIEDSEAGVRAGKAAGMTVLGFVGGSHVDPSAHGLALAVAGADHIFGSMVDLPRLLCRPPRREHRPERDEEPYRL